MSLSSFFSTDTYIAFGLIGIVIIVYFFYRLGMLPKKSIPYVAGALLALFGIHIFREWRSKKLWRDLEELEKQIKEKEKRLQQLKEKYGTSEQELQQVQAELERLRAAYEKTILQLKAENKKLKERIDELQGEELHHEFRNTFGSS
jgi:septal ring factor EnvC (AmiA/AmiB activator)